MKLDTRTPVDRTGNCYCGPLVIAALIRRSTGEVAQLVRMRTGREIIRGISADNIATTLLPHGYRMKYERVPKTSRVYVSPRGKPVNKSMGPTFAQWLRSRPHPAHIHIVDVGRHFVLVHGRKMVDTYTDGEWRFIGRAPHRRRRVRNVWRVYRDGDLP